MQADKVPACDRQFLRVYQTRFYAGDLHMCVLGDLVFQTCPVFFLLEEFSHSRGKAESENLFNKGKADENLIEKGARWRDSSS